MTVLLAGRLVLLPRFDLDVVIDAIDDENPTLFPGVPPIYQALLDAPRLRRTDMRSIRACVSGAMKLPVDVQERFERVTGGRLVEGYGTTEASPATHCTPLSGPRRQGSVGLPLPGTDARVVDPDDPTRLVPVGEPGELVVRGPQVFMGYWSADPTEQPLLDDGWLLTGDIATMDEAGFFTIRRPQEGPHHRRRVQHLSDRSRVGHLRARGRRRLLRHRVAGPLPRRDRQGIRRPSAGGTARRVRRPSALRSAAVGVQGAEVRRAAR